MARLGSYYETPLRTSTRTQLSLREWLSSVGADGGDAMKVVVTCLQCRREGTYRPAGLRLTKLVTPATLYRYEFFCKFCYGHNVIDCAPDSAFLLEEAGCVARTLVVPAEVYERSRPHRLTPAQVRELRELFLSEDPFGEDPG